MKCAIVMMPPCSPPQGGDGDLNRPTREAGRDYDLNRPTREAGGTTGGAWQTTKPVYPGCTNETMK